MARKQTLIELLSEDFRLSDDKSRHIIENYDKEFDQFKSKAELLYNKFTNTAIGDILEESDSSGLKRIGEAADKFSSKVSKINDELEDLASDLYDAYDENNDHKYKVLSEKARDVANKYYGLEKHLDVIYSITTDINDIFDKIKDEDSDKLKDLNKYKDK